MLFSKEARATAFKARREKKKAKSVRKKNAESAKPLDDRQSTTSEPATKKQKLQEVPELPGGAVKQYSASMLDKHSVIPPGKADEAKTAVNIREIARSASVRAKNALTGTSTKRKDKTSDRPAPKPPRKPITSNS